MGNQPNVTINTNSGIAQGLSWRDDFFQDYFSENDEDEIVAVFDLDYDRLESHYKCLSWSCLGVSSICMPSIIPWLLIGLVPCHVNKNVLECSITTCGFNQVWNFTSSRRTPGLLGWSLLYPE